MNNGTVADAVTSQYESRQCRCAFLVISRDITGVCLTLRCYLIDSLYTRHVREDEPGDHYGPSALRGINVDLDVWFCSIVGCCDITSLIVLGCVEMKKHCLFCVFNSEFCCRH